MNQNIDLISEGLQKKLIKFDEEQKAITYIHQNKKKNYTNPETKASLWSHIWFISGKIFIAYGIYQTISAFRKYGK